MGNSENHQRQLYLGLFLLVALSILAFYTLFLTDFQLFGSPAKLVAHFPEAHALREGDPVTIAGMKAGRVRTITYDPGAPDDRRITVELKLDEPIELRTGFTITIEEATMLGGRVVNIDPGPSGAPRVASDQPVQGRVVGNPLSALGDLVSDNQVAVKRFLDDLAAITGDLREGRGVLGRALTDEGLSDQLAASIANLEGFSADAHELTGGLREGRGTLGKLLLENDIYDTIKEVSTGLKGTVDDLSVLVADMREGRGTFGRLLRDDELGRQVADAIESLSGIVAKLDAGEGSIGRLIHDDTVARNLEKISTDLAEGKGTLGALIASDELYQQLLEAGRAVREVATSVRGGQGTLGRLLVEDELYEEALTAVKLLNSSLEDYREAAPISSFTSVLFSAF